MNNHLNTTSVDKSNTVRKSIIALATAAVLLAGTKPVKGHPSQECNWYLSAGAQEIVSAKGSGPDIDFGSPVLVTGSSSYDGHHLVNMAVGREFTVCDKAGRSSHLRLELEYVDGIVGRKAVTSGVLNRSLDDKVDLRALFLNGFIRIAKTDNFRLWFGPGIGYAWTNVPDASYATPCGCLKGAKSESLALQLKLQGEKMVSGNSSIFGEVGYANFRGANSGGVPSAHYGDVGVTGIGLGIITRF